MKSKIKTIIIAAIIVAFAVINFELAFRIYEYLSMVCFIPLVVLVFRLMDNAK